MPSPDFRTAVLVNIEENQDAFVVGLSENEAGDGAYLIFQSGLRPPDERDGLLGLDSYCILDEDGAVQYGGVTRAVLAGATLTLTLTEAAAEELGVSNEARTLVLDVPAEDAARLAEGLNRIFTYGNPDKQPELSGF
jgi:Immunity protein 10